MWSGNTKDQYRKYLSGYVYLHRLPPLFLLLLLPSSMSGEASLRARNYLRQRGLRWLPRLHGSIGYAALPEASYHRKLEAELTMVALA